MRSCPVRSAWLSACRPILFHLDSFWYRVSNSFASFSRISRPAREALERDCHGATKVQILPHTVASESVVNRKESQPRLLPHLHTMRKRRERDEPYFSATRLVTQSFATMPHQLVRM